MSNPQNGESSSIRQSSSRLSKDDTTDNHDNNSQVTDHNGSASNINQSITIGRDLNVHNSAVYFGSTGLPDTLEMGPSVLQNQARIDPQHQMSLQASPGVYDPNLKYHQPNSPAIQVTENRLFLWTGDKFPETWDICNNLIFGFETRCYFLLNMSAREYTISYNDVILHQPFAEAPFNNCGHLMDKIEKIIEFIEKAAEISQPLLVFDNDGPNFRGESCRRSGAAIIAYFSKFWGKSEDCMKELQKFVPTAQPCRSFLQQIDEYNGHFVHEDPEYLAHPDHPNILWTAYQHMLPHGKPQKEEAERKQRWRENNSSGPRNYSGRNARAPFQTRNNLDSSQTKRDQLDRSVVQVSMSEHKSISSLLASSEIDSPFPSGYIPEPTGTPRKPGYTPKPIGTPRQPGYIAEPVDTPSKFTATDGTRTKNGLPVPATSPLKSHQTRTQGDASVLQETFVSTRNPLPHAADSNVKSKSKWRAAGAHVKTRVPPDLSKCNWSTLPNGYENSPGRPDHRLTNNNADEASSAKPFKSGIPGNEEECVAGPSRGTEKSISAPPTTTKKSGGLIPENTKSSQSIHSLQMDSNSNNIEAAHRESLGWKPKMIEILPRTTSRYQVIFDKKYGQAPNAARPPKIEAASWAQVARGASSSSQTDRSVSSGNFDRSSTNGQSTPESENSMLTVEEDVPQNATAPSDSLRIEDSDAITVVTVSEMPVASTPPARNPVAAVAIPVSLLKGKEVSR